MNTKLTLNINSEIIIDAKAYAVSHEQSLSKLVETFLKGVNQIDKSEEKLTPLVEELSGCIKLDDYKKYKDEYADYLMEKYS